jgi:hypothetical protein
MGDAQLVEPSSEILEHGHRSDSKAEQVEAWESRLAGHGVTVTQPDQEPLVRISENRASNDPVLDELPRQPQVKDPAVPVHTVLQVGDRDLHLLDALNADTHA